MPGPRYRCGTAMRALVVLSILIAPATARATKKWVPPYERACTQPQPWAKLAACIQAEGGPGAKIETWSPELRVVKLANAAVYLHWRESGDSWRLAAKLGDASYEYLGASKIEVAGAPATKIEMGHVVPMYGEPHPAWFRERVAVVCTRAGCQYRVTACSVMRRGRAVEAFHGALRVDDTGAIEVVADRSRAGAQCRHR
jgi:hypothetical protein